MTSPTEALIQEHAPLVRRLALKLSSRLPASVELDDLIQSGMIGLLDAAKRYQNGLGAQFTSYATTRINGAMLDELRRQDWLPRSVRTRARQIEAAIQEIEQEIGRSATESEIANHMGISTEAFHDLLDDAQGIQLVHYEDISTEQSSGADILDSIASDAQTPLDALMNHDFKVSLIRAVAGLPEKEKLILSLSYEQDLNLMEIGKVLNLSNGRVSQLRTQAIVRLRATLKKMAWDQMPGDVAVTLVNS